MAVSIRGLRIWFGVLALAAVAVVGGVYLRARRELRETLRDLPGKVGLDIQQTSEGFTLSKSEGGRTLFTVHASKATQFKLGGRAELHDVKILVYGRDSDHFDQIYGDDFEYDQRAGTVASTGEVHIDLEGGLEGGPRGKSAGKTAGPAGLKLDGKTLPHMKNPIHLQVQGMTFNQRTGLAESQGLVDFRFPQAIGTAHGATYDSKSNQLTLHSAVDIQTEGKQPTHIVAGSGTISKEPRVVTLERVQMSGESRTLLADSAIVHLAADNSVERVNAAGNVRLDDSGGMQLRAPKGELSMGARNTVESAFFTGGVDFESAKQAVGGHSGEMLMRFAARESKTAAGGAASRLENIYASQGAVLRQAPRAGSAHPQEMVMSSDAMTLALNQNEQLSSAQTEGPGELTILPVGTGKTDNASLPAKGAMSGNAPLPVAGAGKTVIDAQHFTADFGEQNRLRTLHGMGAVKVTRQTPGQPEQVSTSDSLVAEFSPAGQITRAVQEGDFRFREELSSKDELGGRRGWAARASYSPQDESLVLTGDPRVVDGGTTVTAQTIRLLRSGGEMSAVGEVKTTYSELNLQPNGALLASSEPVHVTAEAMQARQSTGVAHYTGGARLWQGSNIVQAQTIDFDQKARSIVALGDAGRPVRSVFLQVERKGKSSTVLVTAPRLSYSDGERVARYTGGVTAKSEDGGVMTAERAEIFLNPAGTLHSSGPSQLDHIVASGQVAVQQEERRAEGETLVYTASSGTYVMTGGTPELSDPVNGTVRGDSLTFYSHDDRVVVEGSSSSRAVTHTHVSR